MTHEEYQCYINKVQEQYQYLNLTYEQAERIFIYEQEKINFSFSVWEGWDYELATFREILNEEQLKSHEAFLQECIEGYKNNLIEQDSKMTNGVTYYEALIHYYETDFLPDFFKDPYFTFAWLWSDRAKIEYLKKEYKHFLNDTKKGILTNHFRHNRTCKPNELKASLLGHKLSCILPDYISFTNQMDEPTKAVAHYLQRKLKHLPYKMEELLIQKFKDLKAFKDTIIKKYYGEIRGWGGVEGQLTTEEERQHRTMTLLLLDREKYGC